MVLLLSGHPGDDRMPGYGFGSGGVNFAVALRGPPERRLAQLSSRPCTNR